MGRPTVVVLSALTLSAVAARAGNLPKMSIDDLMREVDEFYDDVKDQQYSMVMYLVEPDGSQKERRLSYKAKGEDYAITHFHYPDSVSGMGFLQEPGDNMHVYLPEFQKVRKVAAHTKRQSFMGSDFSYNDMNNERYSRDYEAELVDDSGDRYIIKLTPKPGVDIQYSKLVLTVEPVTFMIDTIELFDEGGQRVKVQTREDPVKLDKIWIQRKITMEDEKSHHKTVLLLQDIKLNTGISDDEFTVRNLRRVN